MASGAGGSKESARGQTTRLVKLKTLGLGSYGSVHVAMFGDTVCAAKSMHQVLFQIKQDGKPSMVEQFEQECDILQSIRHPCIVQFLGKTTDPQSALPILLMELMDESLTHFLEKSSQPPLYHLQVNICHDVASALSYIHSIGYIHRDVSSNNILLVAGSCKAKLSDFGVSKLANDQLKGMTVCPGSSVYMAPECTVEGDYSNKIDIFSLGVIGVQIATCKFPAPTDQYTAVSMPTSGLSSSTLMRKVTEVERRQNHFRLIPNEHLLKRTFLECLQNDPAKRPSAHSICELLVKHKESTVYVESLQSSKSQESHSLQEKCDSLMHRVHELTSIRESLLEDLRRSEAEALANSAAAEEQREHVSALQRDIENLQRAQISQESQPSSSRSFLGGLFRNRDANEHRLRQAEQERREALQQRDDAIKLSNQVQEEAKKEVIRIRDDLEWKEARLSEKEGQYRRALAKYDELEVDYNRKCHLLQSANNELEQLTVSSGSGLEEEVKELTQKLKERDELLNDLLVTKESGASPQRPATASQPSLESFMECIHKAGREEIEQLKKQLSDKEKELEASQKKVAGLENELQKQATTFPYASLRAKEPEAVCSGCVASLVDSEALRIKDCSHQLCKSCLINLVEEAEVAHEELRCPVSTEYGTCSSSIPAGTYVSLLEEVAGVRLSPGKPEEASSATSFDAYESERLSKEVNTAHSCSATGSAEELPISHDENDRDNMESATAEPVVGITGPDSGNTDLSASISDQLFAESSTDSVPQTSRLEEKEEHQSTTYNHKPLDSVAVPGDMPSTKPQLQSHKPVPAPVNRSISWPAANAQPIAERQCKEDPCVKSLGATPARGVMAQSPHHPPDQCDDPAHSSHKPAASHNPSSRRLPWTQQFNTPPHEQSPHWENPHYPTLQDYPHSYQPPPRPPPSHHTPWTPHPPPSHHPPWPTHPPPSHQDHYSPYPPAHMESWPPDTPRFRPRTAPIHHYPPEAHYYPPPETYVDSHQSGYHSLNYQPSLSTTSHRAYTSPHPLHHGYRRPHPHHSEGRAHEYSSMLSQHPDTISEYPYQQPPSSPDFQTDTKSLFSSLSSSDRQPDEYLAVLMQQRHIESMEHPWKVVFTVCLRMPCCVKPLQDLLRETFREQFEVASFCIKFKEAVILKIPEEEMRAQGYSISTDVSPCKIAMNEVLLPSPMEFGATATATYPPRHILTISPLPSQGRRKLAVSLKLNGVEPCVNQREFNLKSPALLPTPTATSVRAEANRPSQPPAAVSVKSGSEKLFNELLQAEADTNSVATLLGSFLSENTLLLGQMLGISFEKIKQIQAQSFSSNYPNPQYHCVCELVEYWRTHSTHPTWHGIVVALKRMNRPQLVRSVEHHLRQTYQ